MIEDYENKKMLAKSHNTPVHILEQLAQDPDGQIQCCVIQNEATPYSIIEKLSLDYKGNPTVRREAEKKLEKRRSEKNQPNWQTQHWAHLKAR